MSPFPRICISSTSGGGGKTLLSLGLCRAFFSNGIAVKPFKKGPDYIDAAWLSKAAKAPCTNLDPFFLDATGLRQLFTQSMGGYGLGIIEGNRGLYDGLNETGSCSTAQVARAINCPILLCVDCEKSTRTVAALLKGLISFETGLVFAGVVLNRVGSARHEASLCSAIETNTDLRILGVLPRLKKNPLPERHMGLASCNIDRNESLADVLAQIAAYVRSHCDLDAIFAAAQKADPLPDCPTEPLCSTDSGPTIGIARDAALWFYYEENLQALIRAGAKLRFISLLDGRAENIAAWENLDGLYLGGGFPEDYCDILASSGICAKIRQFADAGMPIYAECGGLIVLGESLQAGGKIAPMAGVFPTNAELFAKPQGLGYVEAEVTMSNPWFDQGLCLRGHEFHYSRITSGWANAHYALTLKRGVGIEQVNGQTRDGIVYKNVWGSYTHFFAPAAPVWAKNFVKLASSYKS